MLPQVEELATVVVCEDDDPTRELLCDHLTADRYRALPAPSASDALRLCGYNHPDLMLLDLGLPDAPGIDVLREIRSSGERFDPELPVLVLSGRSSEADRLRGFEAGADDYLQKPFHYPELLARVAAVLRRRNGGSPRADPGRRSDRRPRHPPGHRGRAREVELANKEFALLQRAGRGAAARLHQGRAVARRLGLPLAGPDPHPRLARQPPAAQARSGWRALRLQLLGRRLQAARGVITPAHKRALNRALHELRRPLQALVLLEERLRPARGGTARRQPARSAGAGRRAPSGTSMGRSTAASWAARADRVLLPRGRARLPRALAPGGGPRGGIRVYWDAGPAPVEGDPRRMAQALDNLISNALEHGGPPVVVTGARVAGSYQDHDRERRRDRPRTPGRGDPRRGHGTEIVSEVASAHRGRFALCQTGGGCVAALELPLAEPGYALAA